MSQRTTADDHVSQERVSECRIVFKNPFDVVRSGLQSVSDEVTARLHLAKKEDLSVTEELLERVCDRLDALEARLVALEEDRMGPRS